MKPNVGGRPLSLKSCLEEIARLGGLAVSRDREHMARIGAIGAEANLERNGADQPLRAALKQHGYAVAPVAPSTKNSR